MKMTTKAFRSPGTLAKVAVFFAALAGLASPSRAAISVGPSGSGILTFDTIPAATEWSTSGIGSGAGGDDPASMDAAMQATPASAINSALTTKSSSATSETAYWRDASTVESPQSLCTQPTSVKMTALMARLQNTSGGVIEGLNVHFDFGLATTAPSEAFKGYRVFWSKTGATNSWTPVGSLIAESPGVTPTDLAMEFIDWADGESLFVVWVDDNGFLDPDGDFTIDNVNFTTLSPQASIKTFGLPGNPGLVTSTGPTTGSINITVPYGTDLTQLAPVFTMSNGATCDHDSGITNYDFTGDVDYIVTSADSQIIKTYTVTVDVTPASSANSILTFGLPNSVATITGSTIEWLVPFGTNVTNLAPTYTVSQFATGSPISGTALNFTTPQDYTVTAQDGSENIHTVTVVVSPPSPYIDAINVNFASSAALVTGTQATPETPAGVLAGSWNNITSMGLNIGGVYASPVFAAPPVTAMGTPVPTFSANAQNGGWGSMTITTGPGGPNTLTQYQASNNSRGAFGNPNHWNWYLRWENLPASFDNYDVWALNDGTWVKVAANMTTSSGETTPHRVVFKTGAIQFLQHGAQDMAYSNWIGGYYPTPGDPDAEKDVDPDHDGSNNFAEFAFLGNPQSGSDQGYLRSAIEDTDDDTLMELTLTLAVRNAAGVPVFSGSPSPTTTVDGVIYTIQGSLDLAFPNSIVTETTAPTGLPVLPTGWEYRRFRLDASEGLMGKGFMRAAAEPTP